MKQKPAVLNIILLTAKCFYATLLLLQLNVVTVSSSFLFTGYVILPGFRIYKEKAAFVGFFKQ